MIKPNPNVKEYGLMFRTLSQYGLLSRQLLKYHLENSGRPLRRTNETV